MDNIASAINGQPSTIIIICNITVLAYNILTTFLRDTYICSRAEFSLDYQYEKKKQLDVGYCKILYSVY